MSMPSNASSFSCVVVPIIITMEICKAPTLANNINNSIIIIKVMEICKAPTLANNSIIIIIKMMEICRCLL